MTRRFVDRFLERRVVAALMLAVPAMSPAQSSPIRLSQLHHTAWRSRDGAPSEIWSLAQTRDGYLWMGTSGGLFRFDGVQFERFEAPKGESFLTSDVSTVYASPDGSLWLGYRFGGISRIDHGHIMSFDERAGLPAHTVYQIAQDSAGTVWVATTVGLYRGERGTWRLVGRENGMTSITVSAVVVDKGGTVWVGGDSGVAALARDQRTFGKARTSSLANSDLGFITVAKNGSVWTSSTNGVLRQLVDSLGNDSRVEIPLRALTGIVASDNEGYLWIGVANGFVRSPTATLARGMIDTTDRLDTSGGLSGSFFASLVRDREGDIWVGTSGGVDRFRRPRLTAVVLPKQLSAIALAPGDSGTVIVGSVFEALQRIRSGHVESLRVGANAQSIQRTADGSTWIAGTNLLLHGKRDREFVEVPMPSEVRDITVQAVSEDAAGTLWLSVPRIGLFRRDHGSWARDTASLSTLGAAPIVMYPARDGRMWFGYTRSTIAERYRGEIRTYGPSQGLNIGNVTAICEHASTLWVGGEGGVMWLNQGRFHALAGKGGQYFRGVSGVVVRRNGELWMNGADGIMRVPSDEVAHAMRDSGYRVSFEQFDALDGLDGAPTKVRPVPTAVEGSDGRLWFARSTGVFTIDPSSIARSTVAPPVFISSVIAHDSTYGGTDTVNLPARTSAVQVRFTALGLAFPERIRFRYRLDDLDTSWTDVGSRREAFYTNLGPGIYRFHVSAANEDGVWSDEGAVQVMRIAPTFTQSSAFVLIATLSLLGALWAGYLVRLRAVAASIRARYDARLEERTRIAEELHDTLLQGFTGITLQLQGLRKRLTEHSSAVDEELATILTSADASLRDARHAVWDMRGPDLESVTLAEALETAARDGLLGSSIALTFMIRGVYRRLPLVIEHALLRIGREAVINAVKHSAAHQVDLDLRYAADCITLSVCDDGDGINVESAAMAPSHGHWGLVGMRDRAERVGGRLEIRQRAERGAEILVTIMTPRSDGARRRR